MVVLNRIYTKTGDAGETALVNGARVAKHSPRVCAYGTVDELNSVLGLCRLHAEGVDQRRFAVGVRHIAEAALSMTRQALDAFARLDAPLALSVIRADDAVDIEFKAVLRQLITHMMEDPRTITQALEVMTIARAIERIGDHAKNVSELVVYIAEGRDIRHAKSQKASEDGGGEQ